MKPKIADMIGALDIISNETLEPNITNALIKKKSPSTKPIKPEIDKNFHESIGILVNITRLPVKYKINPIKINAKISFSILTVFVPTSFPAISKAIAVIIQQTAANKV